MDISENEDKFIYKKVDFLKIGVKEGSFNKLITDLGLDSSEYCCYKTLPEDNNRKTRYFTGKAYEKVLKSVKDKEQTKNNVELTLFQENQNLKQQIMELTTRATILENSFLKEKQDLKDEIYNCKIKEKDLELKLREEQDWKVTSQNNYMEEYDKRLKLENKFEKINALSFKGRLKFLFKRKFDIE